MKQKHLKVQVEWEWLESNVMPNIDDTYELNYHREQFDQNALREYMQFILANFLDKPDNVYALYWEKALQPTVQQFKSFKSYFERSGYKFSDENTYHKLFFLSLILWRNFAYNGSVESNTESHKIYQDILTLHNERTGRGNLKKERKKLLNDKRNGKEMDVILGKKGVKDGLRARSYVYWTGKLYGPLLQFENVKTDEHVVNLIGLLFCTATTDFREKYNSFLRKKTRSKQKKNWKKYLYDTIRSYKNRHPAFTKESLKGLEYILMKLKAGENINFSDPRIPDYVLRKMDWRRENRILTSDDIERFIEKYSRHRPHFTKAGIWPSQYDNPNSETRKKLTKEKRKAKIKKLAQLQQGK